MALSGARLQIICTIQRSMTGSPRLFDHWPGISDN